MGLDKVMVLVAAVALCGLIVWWFFAKRSNNEVAASVSEHEQRVTITVDGGYTPNVVSLKRGIPVDITFLRKDPSACLEEVIFPDFGVRAKLPVNKEHHVKINPRESGEYRYACGMNMFHGTVVVR